jgi:AAA15 family ATPase/GTPase
VPVPFVSHRTGSRSFELPLTLESSGTKRLFVLLGAFLPVLTEGGVAVIDEMESDLHPHLIPLLLDLFVDATTNPKRAQLLFTCHHVEILNQLAKEQIVLVQKDDECVSTLRRLADIKGVKREENFFAHYNAGRYEAVPSPSLF